MPGTQNSSRKNTHHAGTKAESVITVSTQNGPAKAALQCKRPREAEDAAIMNSEPPAPVKKAKTTVHKAIKVGDAVVELEPAPTKTTARKAIHSHEAHDMGVVESGPLAPAKKTTVSRSKCPREADDIAITDLEPAPAKKAKSTVSKARRQGKANDTAIPDTEQAIPTKKVKTIPEKAENPSQPGARHSSQAQTKTPKATTARRTQCTKEEIAAAKAEAEAEKERGEQLTKENHQVMMRMDANEDINRVETAAQAIRTFSDLNHDLSGEEFIGYEEISSGEDSDIQSEDAETLKVRFLS